MRQIRRIPKLPLPPRSSDAHKGDFGKVLLVAGSPGMLGAAVLCARAATRSGVGLVRVGLPLPLMSLLPLSVPEVTTFAVRGDSLRKQIDDVDAVVIGPGLTSRSSTKQQVKLVMEHSRVPVVLDADALNVLAPLKRKLKSRAQVIMTPHPGEAARLLGTSAATVQADRMHAATQLCQQSGAIVVLKGEGTLVVDGKQCYRNRTGNPGMASGGSGDVLSGLLGALLACGMSPFDASCLAVNVHGKAGDRARDAMGENGMIASDIIDRIPEVMG